MNIGLENYISVSICTHVKSLRILVHRLGKLSNWNPVKYLHYKDRGEKNALQFSTWNVHRFPSMNSGFIHHINPSVSFSQLKYQPGILCIHEKFKSFYIKTTSMPHSPTKLFWFKTYSYEFWAVSELIVPWKAFLKLSEVPSGFFYYQTSVGKQYFIKVIL